MCIVSIMKPAERNKKRGKNKEGKRKGNDASLLQNHSTIYMLQFPIYLIKSYYKTPFSCWHLSINCQATINLSIKCQTTVYHMLSNCLSLVKSVKVANNQWHLSVKCQTTICQLLSNCLSTVKRTLNGFFLPCSLICHNRSAPNRKNPL